MTFTYLLQFRFLLTADRHYLMTSGMKVTTRWWVKWRRHITMQAVCFFDCLSKLGTAESNASV